MLELIMFRFHCVCIQFTSRLRSVYSKGFLKAIINLDKCIYRSQAVLDLL